MINLLAAAVSLLRAHQYSSDRDHYNGFGGRGVTHIYIYNYIMFI